MNCRQMMRDAMARSRPPATRSSPRARLINDPTSRQSISPAARLQPSDDAAAGHEGYAGTALRKTKLK